MDGMSEYGEEFADGQGSDMLDYMDGKSLDENLHEILRKQKEIMFRD